jgi:lysophospholipase L1-like esterase
LFYNLVKKSYEITKKEFPNSEFIIIDYPLSRPEIFYKDEFEAMGIKVYNANELAGVNLIQEKYQLSKDDCHPNAKAWELIAPALVKKEKM